MHTNAAANDVRDLSCMEEKRGLIRPAGTISRDVMRCVVRNASTSTPLPRKRAKRLLGKIRPEGSLRTCSSILNRPQRAQRYLLHLGQAFHPADIQALVGPVMPQGPQMLAIPEIPY